MTLDCSEDRAVNEGQICTAIAAMLERIGITVGLNVQPRAKHFDKILRRAIVVLHDELGWAAHDRCARHVEHGHSYPPGLIRDLESRRHSNTRVDDLIRKIESENDNTRRNAMIREALPLHKDDIGHIPIHTQNSAWAAREGIKLQHSADDFVRLHTVVVEK